jgi:hypothetical protein
VVAELGAHDLDGVTPLPELLREVSGIEPEPSGMHVLLDGSGVTSMQRLVIGDLAGSVLAALWPAELQGQARYVYGGDRGEAVVAAARAQGWTAAPSPHIAFFTAQPAVRLYMSPLLDAAEYVRRWEQTDLGWVRQFPPEEVRGVLWPWLKRRGYAMDSDDPVLDQFLRGLGRRPAHMRPGLRLRHRWDAEAIRGLGGQPALSREIRRHVNMILAAADEPQLPASRP